MKKIVIIILINCILLSACASDAIQENSNLEVINNQVESKTDEILNDDLYEEVESVETTPSEIDQVEVEGFNVKGDGFYAELTVTMFEWSLVEAINEQDYGFIEKFLPEDTEIMEFYHEMITEWGAQCEEIEFIDYEIEEMVMHEDESYTICMKRIWNVSMSEGENQIVEETHKYTLIGSGGNYVISDVEDME